MSNQNHKKATVRIAPNLRIASAAEILGLGGYGAGDRAMEFFQAVARGEVKLGR